MRRHYRGLILKFMVTFAILGSVSLSQAGTVAPKLQSLREAALYSVVNMPPLYVAAIAGNKQKVEDLIAQGVDVNAQLPTSGLTALHGATTRNHPEIVKLLLKNGARKDIADASGKMPADLAIELNRTDINKMLAQ